MEQARLRAVIGLDLQRVLVLPGDVQMRRQPHDAGAPYTLHVLPSASSFAGSHFIAA